MSVAGGGSSPSGALAAGLRAVAAVRSVPLRKSVSLNRPRDVVNQMGIVFRVDAAALAQQTATAGPMNVTMMSDPKTCGAVNRMRYGVDMPDMLHLGDQPSLKGATVGVVIIGIGGDAASMSTGLAATEVTTRHAPANPAVKSGIGVVATWGAAPAILPTRIRGREVTVIWGVIPSLSIVAGRDVGGPGGPRPHYVVLPTSGADLGSAAAILQSCPASLATIAHIGRVRAAIRGNSIGMHRDLRHNAVQRMSG